MNLKTRLWVEPVIQAILKSNIAQNLVFTEERLLGYPPCALPKVQLTPPRQRGGSGDLCGPVFSVKSVLFCNFNMFSLQVSLRFGGLGDGDQLRAPLEQAGPSEDCCRLPVFPNGYI